MNRSRSHDLFRQAQAVLPGGVHSPVRAFRGVGGDPVFFERGEGAWLVDVDGNRYVDYVGSWGPLLMGHAWAPAVDAVCEAAKRGTSFGAPHEAEVVFAEAIIRAVPSVEKVRLVSSGTEATSAAIRLARAATGRDRILKFEGCYHGAADSLLVKAGSGVETLGLPDSPGVPADLAKHTLTLPYNDIEKLREFFDRHGDTIAGAILEPVVGNMGVLPPKEGFHEALRELCTKHGTVLIWDEVMTGFRLARGGAQARFGITPDLTTFGKVIGGGLPVGAYGGKRELMKLIAPEGPVYQAGTLSGNPLAVAAGQAMLKAIEDPALFDGLEKTSARLCDGLSALATEAGVPHRLNRVGSMWTIFFTPDEVYDYPTAKTADTKRFGRFYHAMLDRGVYLPPSQFEAAFVSTAHGDAEVEHTLAAAREAFKSL
ncbi:glutamate-1-semialdehyde 2,1-aminomutase [Vulgatibacter incomptus]|uniref:Glutamate-1-semialdehyde 2,1-aminomutase n=1 Tax=Vulgatibacter incomptus TaxID=1391653 RepID=A0A0K1PJA9_9BACT|nr:glutamate-1-semialdehyde 2,1-aminomutase [Vulgatibacter incomptus]AKU93184.1 Glutamate-1-semialdehyde aminotransferase [Vulgatibacter incomptus]